MLLGKGTYGSVRVRGNAAVKKFHDLRHLIQEYIAGSYLDNARNIVRIYEVDLQKLKLSMELYDMNLRQWMEHAYTSGGRGDRRDRMFVLHEILVGMCEMHERGLVHGDIKPGNMLLNVDSSGNVLKVAIGDLGFVSLHRYAKVQYTAKVYRDSVIRQSSVHDMFSLGILMLELFGKGKVRTVCTYKELTKIAQHKIKDPKICQAIVRLLDEDPQKRPKASAVLFDLFGETIDIDRKSLPKTRDLAQCSNAFSQMRTLGAKYKLAMIERCIEALKFYIQTHEVDLEDCIPYGIVMLLISTSLYRISRFDLPRALKNADLEVEDFLFYLQDILRNDDVLTLLLKA